MSSNNKINSRIIGASGEYYVMYQILRRGYLAALTPDGAPNSDIIVTDIYSERLCSVQVKTRRDIGSDKGWHMKDKHEDIVSDGLFYCFVDMGKSESDSVSTYVVPSKVVSVVLKEAHKCWLSKPGAKGQKRNDSKMRRMLPDYSRIFSGTPLEKKYSLGWLEEYRENWSLIVK